MPYGFRFLFMLIFDWAYINFIIFFMMSVFCFYIQLTFSILFIVFLFLSQYKYGDDAKFWGYTRQVLIKIYVFK
jgi:hypothetical protein